MHLGGGKLGQSRGIIEGNVKELRRKLQGDTAYHQHTVHILSVYSRHTDLDILRKFLNFHLETNFKLASYGFR